MPEESESAPGDEEADDGGSSWAPPTGTPQEPPPDVSPGDESGTRRSVPFPDAPKPRRRRRIVLVAAAAIVVVGLVATLLVIVLGGDDDTMAVATADGEVVNPDAVLDEATTEFLLAARSTGARSGSRAGCFWHLGGQDGDEPHADAIMCGPARFAAGGDWLRVPIESEADGEEGATVEYSMEDSEFISADESGVNGGEVELIGVEGAEPQDVDLENPERGGHAFLPDGRRLEEADELINRGVELISTKSGEVAPRVQRRASCWLPSDKLDVDEPTPEGEQGGNSEAGDSAAGGTAALLCGPVLELRDDPSMPWKLLRFDVDAAGGPWAAIGDAESLEVVGSLSFPDNADLYHPEGQEPPEVDGFRPPDPLPVDDDYAAAALVGDLDGNPYLGDLEFEPNRANTVRTPDFTATLNQRATTRRLGDGPEALIAPKGHQFVVFTYAAQPTPPASQANTGAQRLRLVAGKTRRDLSLGELPAIGARRDRPRAPRLRVGDTGGRTVIVVAVVPRKTKDAELAISNRGRTQRVSMRKGRGTDIVDGGNRHGDVVPIGVPFDIALRSPGAANAPQPPAGDGFLRGQIAQARIAVWDENRGWAPEGTVFVSVEFPQATDDMGGPGWVATYAWRQTVALRTPDDQVLQPLGVPDAPQPLPNRPQPLRFAVPADVDNVALIIDPQGFAQFPEGNLQFPIEVDQPFETSFTLR